MPARPGDAVAMGQRVCDVFAACLQRGLLVLGQWPSRARLVMVVASGIPVFTLIPPCWPLFGRGGAAFCRRLAMTLLILCADDMLDAEPAQALVADLRAAGLDMLGTAPCHFLVREVVRLAPQAVVLVAQQLDAPLLAALALLAASAPRPVLVVGPAEPPTLLAPLLDVHVMAWLPGPCNPVALRAALALAVPRFAREQALRLELQSALARLDERKWVDRAKGVLMHRQQLTEDAAFVLLREASMQANLRVGEVSRGLIEAAEAAEAVNRAGQLRMLSQRYVKALALRGAGLADTAQHLQSNLDRLAGMNPVEPVASLLGATTAAWLALRQAGEAGRLAVKPDSAKASRAAQTLKPARAELDSASQGALAEADRLAEILLDHAHALTAALAGASGRVNLRLVNVSGRQRMLSQRLAKQALLADLLPAEQAGAHAEAAARTVADFEASLVWLEQAPLATEAIRATLAQARGQWLRLLNGLRGEGGATPSAGRAALVRESEALLASFDELTSLYEHSMQVLLG